MITFCAGLSESARACRGALPTHRLRSASSWKAVSLAEPLLPASTPAISLMTSLTGRARAPKAARASLRTSRQEGGTLGCGRREGYRGGKGGMSE